MIAGETKIAIVLIQSPSVGLVLSVSEAHELVSALLDNIEVAQNNQKRQTAMMLQK
jgi:hypothetical protein